MTKPVSTHLARWRVPLGFVTAAAAFWLADPTPASTTVGLAVALPGELLRLWAAGHIEKGREITTSGPYRYVRHPLYLGSSILGAGFVIAARSWPVAGLAAAYLAMTLLAAVRTEEAALDDRFGGAYTRYREGRLAGDARRFSWTRAMANREYRTVSGFLMLGGLLALKAWA